MDRVLLFERHIKLLVCGEEVVIVPLRVTSMEDFP